MVGMFLENNCTFLISFRLLILERKKRRKDLLFSIIKSVILFFVNCNFIILLFKTHAIICPKNSKKYLLHLLTTQRTVRMEKLSVKITSDSLIKTTLTTIPSCIAYHNTEINHRVTLPTNRFESQMQQN